MVRQERCKHAACVVAFGGFFLQTSKLQVLFERSCSETIKRTGPLRYVIDDYAELLIVLLKEIVQLREVRPFHVPMEAAALRVKNELVGEHRVENANYGLTLQPCNAYI